MKKQKGMGFLGTLLIIVAAIILFITGLRVAPAYIEYFAVKNILRSLASSAEVQGGNPKEIRNAFDKRASIDNISSIKGEDLDINKSGNGTVVNAVYTVKTPLVANVSVVIDFKASSDQRR
jgi:Domain of unknown function (DUF4845)